MFEECRAFGSAHGHFNVPVTDPEFSALCKWLTHQKAATRRGKINADRAAKLREIGVPLPEPSTTVLSAFSDDGDHGRGTTEAEDMSATALRDDAEPGVRQRRKRTSAGRAFHHSDTVYDSFIDGESLDEDDLDDGDGGHIVVYQFGSSSARQAAKPPFTHKKPRVGESGIVAGIVDDRSSAHVGLSESAAVSSPSTESSWQRGTLAGQQQSRGIEVSRGLNTSGERPSPQVSSGSKSTAGLAPGIHRPSMRPSPMAPASRHPHDRLPGALAAGQKQFVVGDDDDDDDDDDDNEFDDVEQGRIADAQAARLHREGFQESDDDGDDDMDDKTDDADSHGVHWAGSGTADRRQQLTSSGTSAAGPDGDRTWARWRAYFAELQTFRERFHHCNVPANSVEHRRLYEWLCEQREWYMTGQLPAQLARRLVELGVAFAPPQPEQVPAAPNWRAIFDIIRHRIMHGEALGTDQTSWLGMQRALLAQGALTGVRGKLMQALLERYDAQERQPSSWKKAMDGLLIAMRGGLQLQAAQVEWIESQRQLLNSGHLSASKERALRTVVAHYFPEPVDQEDAADGHGGGPAGETSDHAWNELFSQYRVYRRAQGDVAPPEDTKLGRWVERQRREYRAGRLSQERIGKLAAEGLSLESVQDVAWEKRFEELQAFRDHHGHADVPVTYADNVALGAWLARQVCDARACMYADLTITLACRYVCHCVMV
jgi:hypothetical protein